MGGFDRRHIGAFRAWLRTILAHRIRDHFRNGKYRPAATGDSAFLVRLADLEAPDSDLSQQWDREHDQHLARQALRTVEQDFAPATWRAFCLQALEGRRAAEVARELGMTLNSVLLAKSHVLKRLRTELQGLVD